MKQEENLAEALIGKLKSNPLLAWVIMLGVCIIGLASFGKAVVELISLPKQMSASIREKENILPSRPLIVSQRQSDVDYWKSLLCKRDTTPILSRDRPLALISDQEQIRLLIEAEGQAAVQKDIFRHVSLFTKDALFREPGRDWSGCDNITDRDVILFRYTRFLHIREEILDLKVSNAIATATTRHLEEYIAEGRGSRPPADAQSVFTLTGYTTWAFVKDRGVWRIHTFVGGSRPFSTPANPTDREDSKAAAHRHQR
ncbi:MAG TPA: nuclear transport factor 2 family protein [Thermoanaerobaculia bacterium]|nr:nuclear transport factor 2 family protein [Thermoanaerobaculia bacterium]